MEYKTFVSEVKGYSEDDLTVDHWITIEIEDRSGDTLFVDGMVIEGRPVVLHSHGQHPQIGGEPVGKPLFLRPGTFKGYKGIEARTKFYPDSTGIRLWRKTTEGFFPNWSVGFIPITWTDNKTGRGRKISQWILCEYSLCAVGCNYLAQTPEKAFQGLSFKFMNDNHRCRCGKNLCLPGNGKSFQCLHELGKKDSTLVKLPSGVTIERIKGMVKYAVLRSLRGN
ncbi:MAG: hypothetical protein NT096_01655 [Proteobacteria bacterium]|nr:hypothetical protein [Pseudomonadota bacterium]